ncbi:MAG: hypothetical protein J6A26_03770 [Oscillospiraceae bacterium]|nr:hypothetical protein [Oscillospiraceae bacterium]
MAEQLLENNEVTLPFSLEAEQSVLGAILLKPECLSTVLEYISAESFYRNSISRSLPSCCRCTPLHRASM